MATKNIIKLLEKSNIAKDLKVAYSFMLLSRGYSADEIKVLDDYVFSVSKKESGETDDTNKIVSFPPRKRKQRIGTYSYTTQSGVPMTVPVIDGKKE